MVIMQSKKKRDFTFLCVCVWLKIHGKLWYVRVKNHILKCFVATLSSPGKVWDPVNSRSWKWMFCCYIVQPRKSRGLKNECFVATLSSPGKVWDWKMNVLLLHRPAQEKYGIEKWMFCCYIVQPRKSMGLKKWMFCCYIVQPQRTMRASMTMTQAWSPCWWDQSRSERELNFLLSLF